MDEDATCFVGRLANYTCFSLCNYYCRKIHHNDTSVSASCQRRIYTEPALHFHKQLVYRLHPCV